MAAATHTGTRFVPINWHFHAEEVAYVLDNSDAKALLAGQRFAALAAETMARDDAPSLGLKAVMGLRGEAPPDAPPAPPAAVAEAVVCSVPGCSGPPLADLPPARAGRCARCCPSAAGA